MRFGYQTASVKAALKSWKWAKRERRLALVKRVLASDLYKRKVARAKAKYSLRSMFNKWRAWSKGRRNFRSAVVHQFYRKR